MKAALKIVVGIAAAAVLVVAGLGAGWLFWGRRLWMPAMMGRFSLRPASVPCDTGTAGRGTRDGGSGQRRVGSSASWSASQDCVVDGTISASVVGDIDTDRAQDAVKAYVVGLGDDNLEIAKLIEFEHNFYVVVREHDTGVGAMELLVDKTTAIVGPEIGPNMMWNARYGTYRRGAMLGGQTSDADALSKAQVLGAAQRWLDAYRPGVTVEEHADSFYGYYTIHTTADGEIEGLLSVHGTTGQVWYHHWHGAFVQMIENVEHGQTGLLGTWP